MHINHSIHCIGTIAPHVYVIIDKSRIMGTNGAVYIHTLLLLPRRCIVWKNDFFLLPLFVAFARL